MNIHFQSLPVSLSLRTPEASEAILIAKVTTFATKPPITGTRLIITLTINAMTKLTNTGIQCPFTDVLSSKLNKLFKFVLKGFKTGIAASLAGFVF